FGTPVDLNVTTYKAKGWGKPGEITINAVATTAVDGSAVPLTGAYFQQGQDEKTTAILVGIGGCIFVPLVGAVAGFFVKGDDVTVPADFTLPSVKVSSDITVLTK
ncbi:MAG TPA: hypothetical protein VEY71_12085, partial [Chitinophagales bacterium]|nr:hypothetical protein [Chitinophagales bacterium]